jgi:hypothetical protein
MFVSQPVLSIFLEKTLTAAQEQKMQRQWQEYRARHHCQDRLKYRTLGILELPEIDRLLAIVVPQRCLQLHGNQ